MIDFFVLMNEPRRPWLDADALKAKFLALSSELHPDRFHQASEVNRVAAQQRYADLNAAYQCLREPKDRLRHLLELELGSKPPQIQSIPSDLMELSMAVADACRRADSFLAEQARITSPLLQVSQFQQGQDHLERIQALQRMVREREETQLERLRELDAAWGVQPGTASTDRTSEVRSLDEIHRLLSYFARWTSQLQDRIVRLTLQQL